MPDYRLYQLRDGHIFSSEVVPAVDDTEAVERSEKKVGDGGAELWCGSRKVRSFKGISESS